VGFSGAGLSGIHVENAPGYSALTRAGFRGTRDILSEKGK